MTDFNPEPLFETDERFAEQWQIDNPLAQGALKHGSITILDRLSEALAEVMGPQPDHGDFGPLGIFPAAIRPALTPLLIEKVQAAAIIVGWKLAQPGKPIRPGCVAEELALELIRREAIAVLEVIGAPEESIEATKRVYDVCEDADILDLFKMDDPAAVAMALSDPTSPSLDKGDMRIPEWFMPFYGGNTGSAPHPLYGERNPDEEPELAGVGSGF
jgi:hypothetical protein